MINGWGPIYDCRLIPSRALKFNFILSSYHDCPPTTHFWWHVIAVDALRSGRTIQFSIFYVFCPFDCLFYKLVKRWRPGKLPCPAIPIVRCVAGLTDLISQDLAFKKWKLVICNILRSMNLNLTENYNSLSKIVQPPSVLDTVFVTNNFFENNKPCGPRLEM